MSQFYEEFEDVCALANNCKGMSFREQLLAPRGRCRGSRLKTYTNFYRVAHREATHGASANSVFTYDQDPPNSAAAEARKELDN